MIVSMTQTVSQNDHYLHGCCRVVSDDSDEAGRVVADFIRLVSNGVDVIYRVQPTTERHVDFETGRIWFAAGTRFSLYVSVGL